MAQTLVKLSQKEDRIVNVVKGKFGLKNKNEAIRLIISKYENELEDALKPELEELKNLVEEEKKLVKEFEKNLGYA